MPQVEGQFYEEFRIFAGDLVTDVPCVDPHSVIPHQRVMVDHAINLSEELAQKPIIISQDNYILDGHHRWYWHVIKPENLNTMMVHMDFEEAVDFLFTFPRTYCYRDDQGHER